MTFLGILDVPPKDFRRMESLSPAGYEVWARGSMFSPEFKYCYVRKMTA